MGLCQILSISSPPCTQINQLHDGCCFKYHQVSGFFRGSWRDGIVSSWIDWTALSSCNLTFPRLICIFSETTTYSSFSTSRIHIWGVKLLIHCFVGDQHARADRATYVHVWMERVRMAKNPHQLWLYIWILTRNRTALPPDSTCLHRIFKHVIGYHDRPPGYKQQWGSNILHLRVRPYGNYTGTTFKLIILLLRTWH